MTDSRERWALILGGSSGMGEATARAFAAAGYNICGIHLDFRASLERVEHWLESSGLDLVEVQLNGRSYGFEGSDGTEITPQR